MTENNQQDSNFDRLQENQDRLKHAKNINGDNYEVISIHQPSYRKFLNERMPLSYINFYITNDAIVLPVFNDPMDKKAIDTISKVFHDRKIVTLEGSRIVEGGGGVHCITQQQPYI